MKLARLKSGATIFVAQWVFAGWLMSASGASVAATPVGLAAVTTPTSGWTGVSNVSVTASGLPGGTIASKTQIALATTCAAGAPVGGEVTTGANSIKVIVGSTSRINFTIPVGLPQGTYYVSISGTTTGGIAFASSGCASLAVSTPLSITSQPAAANVTAPATATFRVGSTGQTPIAYQWQISTDGGVTFTNLAGATEPNYTTPPTLLANNGWRYRVVVSNSLTTLQSSSAILTVVNAPPTTLAVSINRSLASPGQGIAFLVTEAFTGNSYNAGHNVYATVPAYTSVASGAASGNASCSSGSWPCTAGQTIAWGIQTSAPQSQSMQFIATVSTTAPPPVGTSLSSSASTSLSSGAGTASGAVVSGSATGLQLSIDPQAAVIPAGAPLGYTLTYSNTSATPLAANLQVPLPASTGFVAASGGGALDPGTGVIQWNLGAIPAGASGQVTLTVRVANPLVGSPLIVAGGRLLDPASSTVMAQASTIAEAASDATQLAVSASGGIAQPGQSLLFLVTESFTGNSYNAGHNVYATVPAYTSVVQGAVSHSAACSSGSWPCLPGQLLVWGLQTSSPQSQSLQFAATVSSSAPPPAGSLIGTTVTTNISGAGTASASVVGASGSGLQLAMDEGASVVSGGGNLFYTLTYSNISATPVAANLAVPLPLGVTFVSASSGGSFDSNAGVVSWSLGSIAPGASGQATLTVQVIGATVGPTLIVTKAELLDPTSSAVLAQANTTAQAVTDTTQLAVTTTGGIAQAGDVIPFVVTESFTGNSYNAGHNIYATVPAYTSVAQGAASNGANCSSGSWPCTAGQQIVWGAQTSSPQSQAMQFSATVSAGAPPPAGSLLGTVVTTSISGSGSASTSLVSGSSSGMQLAIDAVTSVAPAGGNLTFTLTYTNVSGPSVPAELTVPVPIGVSFVSASGGGYFDPSTNFVRWNLGTIGTGSSGQVALTLRVTSPLVGSPLIVTNAQMLDAADLALLAQASVTTTTSSDLTQLSASGIAGIGLVNFTVTEKYNATGGYNGGTDVFVTVPNGTVVLSQASGTAVGCAGYCSAMLCTAGPFPCPAGAQVYWLIQTDGGRTNTLQFTATISPTQPPIAGSILGVVATKQGTGVGQATASVLAP